MALSIARYFWFSFLFKDPDYFLATRLSDRKRIAVVMFMILLASAIALSLPSFADTGSNVNKVNPQQEKVAGLTNQVVGIKSGSPMTNQETYGVLFNEYGLPSGTLWAVNVSGVNFSTHNASITVPLPLGNFTYAVSNSLGFFTGAPKGVVSVKSSGAAVNISFQGRFSVSSYINLDTLQLVNSTLQLSLSEKVFPVYATYDNYSHTILVAGYSNSVIYVVNQYNLSEIKSFSVPGSPVAVTVDPASGNIYAINSTTLFEYNSTGTLMGSVFIGSSLLSLGFDPGNDQVMLGSNNGNVYAVNSSSLKLAAVISGLTVFNSQSFSYNSNLGAMEAINDIGSAGKIAFIGKNDSILYQLGGPGTIISLLFDELNNKTYYVAINGSTSYLYVLNGSTPAQIRGTGLSFGIGLDFANGLILVTNTQNDTILFVNASSGNVVYAVNDLGMPLIPVGLSGINGALVVNPLDDSLDVIALNDAVSRVTFEEQGLIGQATWAITVNGFSMSSSSGSVAFYESPGEFNYSVSQVPGYVTSGNGTFTVVSQSITVLIAFNKTYGINFFENGLNSGMDWGITFGGKLIVSPSGSNITFYFQNGTYEFNASHVTGFSETPASGVLIVNGSSLDVGIAFSPYSFRLIFNSTGLPVDTTWSLSINGIQEESSVDTFAYQVIPGTYQYTIYPVYGYYPSVASGSATITGSNETVNITWLPYLYKVTFHDNNLPSGNEWFVKLGNGITFTSSTGNVTGYLPDGFYNFTCSSPNTSWAGASGAFEINDGPISININFTLVSYLVHFVESGLPNGTIWQLQIGSSGFESSSSNWIALDLPNGSYHFNAVPANSSYLAANGTFSVSGSNTTVSVAFLIKEYAVSFNETGLPDGTQWGVFIFNFSENQTTSAILNIALPAGTYSFMPVQVYGYNTSSGGSFTIVDENLTITIIYSAEPVPKQLYNITIMEIGLPEGMDWAVSLNGSTLDAYPGGVFCYTLPNGTYNLSIMALNHIGQILPGGLEIVLAVNGNGQEVIAVFYGSVVWIAVDFSISHSHEKDWHDHGDNHHNRDSDSILVNFIVAARLLRS